MKNVNTIIAAVAALTLGLGLTACGSSMNGNGSSTPATTVSSTSSQPQKPTDTSTGPAFRMVSGKVVKVDGSYYDVEEYSGNRVRLHVSNKTVKINGSKNVGDKIRAEITRGGHANSIQ